MLFQLTLSSSYMDGLTVVSGLFFSSWQFQDSFFREFITYFDGILNKLLYSWELGFESPAFIRWLINHLNLWLQCLIQTLWHLYRNHFSFIKGMIILYQLWKISDTLIIHWPSPYPYTLIVISVIESPIQHWIIRKLFPITWRLFIYF